MIALTAVQGVIDGTTVDLGDDVLRRLARSLTDLRKGGAQAGIADIAVLLRQAIIKAQLSGRVLDPELRGTIRVPSSAPPWPSDEVWRRFGLNVLPAGGGRVRLAAAHWAPAWLDCGAAVAVDDAIAERPRRRNRGVPIDPILRSEFPHLTEYLTPGQREAVRAAFLSAPGSTVVVDLPTGAGKTLVFQAATARWRHQGGLVVVIVPTVALALDQEARLRELLPGLDPSLPLTFHSGLLDEERARVTHAVSNGETPIVFTSPEAALGALRRPLQHAAAADRIRVFAIDEAHVVAQWGDDFRPEFQALSGLRAECLRLAPGPAPFRTILLSATLTAEGFDALVRLFPAVGGGRGIDVVAEVALRPEPSYLLAHATTGEQRQEWIMEAIRFLPRPLLLYSTRRTDPLEWERLVREQGFRRVRSVIGGDMSTPEGAEVLRAWRSGEVDIVFATSAFGLGMDQSCVRSVVHACLPETLDRYYQEVGRGGRDGRAAVALLVSEPADLATADHLANEVVIGSERAFERWSAMLSWPTQRHTEGVHFVPLNALPPNLTLSTARNRAWNLRTLGLMARASLIEFVALRVEPPARLEGETSEAYEARVVETARAYSELVGVRILDPRHLERAHFERRIEQVRAERIAADRLGFDKVRELTRLTRPLGDLLRSVYRLEEAGIEVGQSRVSCPITRERGVPSRESVAPPLRTFCVSADLGPRLLADLRAWGEGVRPRRMWLWYPWPTDGRGQRRVREDVIRALGLLSAEGIAEYVVPDSWVDELAWVRLGDLSPHGFVAKGELTESPLSTRALPSRATVLGPRATAAEVVSCELAGAEVHVCIIAEDTRSDERPDRRVRDYRGARPLSELLRQ